MQTWKKYWYPPRSLFWKNWWGFHRVEPFPGDSISPICSLPSKEMEAWQKWIISSKKSSHISKCGSKLCRMTLVIISLLKCFFIMTWRDFTFLFFYFLPVICFYFYFLVSLMLGTGLKDVELKYNRINKWLFIYKQQELLMVTGRK